VGAAVALLAACFAVLGRQGAAVSAVVAAVVAFAFLSHTDLVVTTDDDAVEFVVDVRAAGRVEHFRETVDELAMSRSGPVVTDPSLREPLAWHLRDSAVMFGDLAEDAGVVVVPMGQEVQGFTRLGEPWRLGAGWYPDDLDPLPLWRWLVYRESYGSLDSVEAEILVPTP
jgi:hypothetical protein